MSNTPLNLEQLISATEEDIIPYELYENDPEPTPQPAAEPEVEDPKPEPEPDPITEPEPEPEPEVTDQEPIKEPEPDSDPDDSEPNNLEKYYNFLAETGFMNAGEDFKFDGTPESFQEGVQRTRENMLKEAANVLSSRLDPDLKEYVRHKAKGGTGTLREYYNASGTTLDLENIDLNDKANQRAVVTENFKMTTALDDAKITKLVDQLDVSGNLEVEANDALASIKHHQTEARKAYLAAQDRAMEEYRTTLSSAIDKLDHITDDRKKKVRNFVINTVGREDGEYTDFQRKLASISSNPLHQAQLADLVYDYTAENGFDFSRFEKKGKTAGMTDFQKNLESSINTKASVGARSTKTSPKAQPVSWDALIDIFN